MSHHPRFIRRFVSQTVSPVIVEAMAVLAVERPQHPVAWLASYALAHSEMADDLVIVKKSVHTSALTGESHMGGLLAFCRSELEEKGLELQPFEAQVLGMPSDIAVADDAATAEDLKSGQ